jgi:hypothetical protein
MLILNLERENFKKYSNGKGYEITVDTSDSRKCFNVFKVNEIENSQYLPKITVENYNEDNSYNFGIINHIQSSERDIDKAIDDIEKFLYGYTIAKESIEEFKIAIEDGSI